MDLDSSAASPGLNYRKEEFRGLNATGQSIVLGRARYSTGGQQYPGNVGEAADDPTQWEEAHSLLDR